MNIEGRLSEYKQKLQEQLRAKEQVQANIFFIQGAIEALQLLEKDEQQPVVELDGDIVEPKKK